MSQPSQQPHGHNQGDDDPFYISSSQESMEEVIIEPMECDEPEIEDADADVDTQNDTRERASSPSIIVSGDSSPARGNSRAAWTFESWRARCREATPHRESSPDTTAPPEPVTPGISETPQYPPPCPPPGRTMSALNLTAHHAPGGDVFRPALAMNEYAARQSGIGLRRTFSAGDPSPSFIPGRIALPVPARLPTVQESGGGATQGPSPACSPARLRTLPPPPQAQGDFLPSSQEALMNDAFADGPSHMRWYTEDFDDDLDLETSPPSQKRTQADVAYTEDTVSDAMNEDDVDNCEDTVLHVGGFPSDPEPPSGSSTVQSDDDSNTPRPPRFNLPLPNVEPTSEPADVDEDFIDDDNSTAPSSSQPLADDDGTPASRSYRLAMERLRDLYNVQPLDMDGTAPLLPNWDDLDDDDTGSDDTSHANSHSPDDSAPGPSNQSSPQ